MGLTGRLTLQPFEQRAMFLNQVPGLTALPKSFKGVLRVSAPGLISLVGLRGRNNERNEFLITTVVPVDEAGPIVIGNLFFPHIVDGGGYTTQFILFSGHSGQASSGTIQLNSQSGLPLSVTIK